MSLGEKGLVTAEKLSQKPFGPVSLNSPFNLPADTDTQSGNPYSIRGDNYS